jgi:hypothetical protein
MKVRHRYLIVRTSLFGCLLATALGSAIVVADSAPSGQAIALESRTDTGETSAFVAMREPAR